MAPLPGSAGRSMPAKTSAFSQAGPPRTPRRPGRVMVVNELGSVSPDERWEPSSVGPWLQFWLQLAVFTAFVAVRGRIYPLVTPLMELPRTALNAIMTAWQCGRVPLWLLHGCGGHGLALDSSRPTRRGGSRDKGSGS